MRPGLILILLVSKRTIVQEQSGVTPHIEHQAHASNLTSFFEETLDGVRRDGYCFADNSTFPRWIRNDQPDRSTSGSPFRI